MSDCIFCKIACGEITGLRVYEDEHTLAFMDIAGDVDGHMLVIPKKHCVNILAFRGDCAIITVKSFAVYAQNRKIKRYTYEESIDFRG